MVQCFYIFTYFEGADFQYARHHHIVQVMLENVCSRLSMHVYFYCEIVFAKSDKQFNSRVHKVHIEKQYILFTSVQADVDVTLGTQIFL